MIGCAFFRTPILLAYRFQATVRYFVGGIHDNLSDGMTEPGVTGQGRRDRLHLKTPGGALYPKPDSPIIQEFNQALNVDLRAVKSDAFSAEEMNLLFATGEIPDHMLASQNNYLRYQDEGLLREIPLDMVKQHAPTYWRDYANGMVEGVWFDFPSWDEDTESLWALPNGGLEIKHQIVARGDWMEAVGAAVPTAVEEFAEVARQFTFDDPDGDGQKNTWGIATSANSPGSWTSSLRTFLAAFGFEHIDRPTSTRPAARSCSSRSPRGSVTSCAG